jgi:hypothetical protein
LRATKSFESGPVKQLSSDKLSKEYFPKGQLKVPIMNIAYLGSPLFISELESFFRKHQHSLRDTNLLTSRPAKKLFFDKLSRTYLVKGG